MSQRSAIADGLVNAGATAPGSAGSSRQRVKKTPGHAGEQDLADSQATPAGDSAGDYMRSVNSTFIQTYTSNDGSQLHHYAVPPSSCAAMTSSMTSSMRTAATVDSICSNVTLIERAHSMDRVHQKLVDIDEPHAVSADEPDALLRGGYQVQFMEEVNDKLRCPVCLLVLREAVQTPCGHLFCESCLQPILRGKQPRCPMDQQELLSTFADRSTRRHILQLVVKCDHFDKCAWTGALAELEKHVRMCPFEIVACDNVGCDQRMERRLLDEHKTLSCAFRRSACSHCRQRIPTAHMDSHVRMDCQSAPIKCPMGQCKESVPRKALTRHLDNDCQEVEVRCEFGCGQMVMRRQRVDHMADAAVGYQHTMHLFQRLATVEESGRKKDTAVEQLQVKVVHLQEQLDGRSAEVQHLQKAVEGLHKEMAGQSAATSLQDEVQSCRRKQREVEREVQDLGLSLRELKVTSELLGQQEQDFAKQLDLLDLRTLELETSAYEAELVWRIPNFSKLLADAKKGGKLSHYSQPFYTNRHGYKACARLYPNGDGAGAGSYVSLFFVVMAGQHDAILPWPFHQRVTFTLLDQSPTARHHISETFMPDARSSSFQRPVGGMNVASGCPCFIPHQTLRTSSHQYLRDDFLFVKVKIDTGGL